MNRAGCETHPTVIPTSRAIGRYWSWRNFSTPEGARLLLLLLLGVLLPLPESGLCALLYEAAQASLNAHRLRCLSCHSLDRL